MTNLKFFLKNTLLWLKRKFIQIYRFFYLTKIAINIKIFGIQYLVWAISHCPPEYIFTLLSKHGANIGHRVTFKGDLYIDNIEGDQSSTGDFSNLKIGHKCYIGKGVFFDLPEQIIIEEECAISAGVKFITHSDCGDRIMSKWYPRKQGKIIIGQGSWIGVNAVILSGVVLGECCVVSAGAVLTQSFPAYSVIAGVPAKLIKTLPH